MQKEHYSILRNDCGSQAALCVVTKHRSIEEIREYYDAGERIFGENRAEELLKKVPLLPADIQWHFIGHLQRNKVKKILPVVSCIQSLDSVSLAEVIEKEAAKKDLVIPVYIELHLAEEDTEKTGLSPEELPEMLAYLKNCPHIKAEGIMTMGPHTEDEERIRSVFLQAKEIFEKLHAEDPSVHVLSMGMSDDYRIALDCGSNMVRIGTYLFE